MVFYTNMGSRKAQQLAANSRISLLFPWHMLERQVIVLGKAEKLPMLDVMKYFHSRPRDSQIGAWVSKQSSRISARSMLESKFFEMKQKFQQGEIPLPSFWGGFRVTIESMEFWRGRTPLARSFSVPARCRWLDNRPAGALNHRNLLR